MRSIYLGGALVSINKGQAYLRILNTTYQEEVLNVPEETLYHSLK